METIKEKEKILVILIYWGIEFELMAQEVKKIKLDPSKVNGRMGYRTIKRGCDGLASRIALILLSPLFLVLII